MAHENEGGKQEQIKEHSLPGTNQAGKGPGSCEEDEKEIEEHSLPGTNQAGKGPGAPEKKDQ
jgi:hypothetical protein